MGTFVGMSFWILIGLFALMYSLLRNSPSLDEPPSPVVKISILSRSIPFFVAAVSIYGMIALKMSEPGTPNVDRFEAYRATGIFALLFIAGASTGVGLAKLFGQPQLAFAVAGIVVMPFVVLTGAFFYEMVLILLAYVRSGSPV
jgi:hypothetical protein